MGNPFEQQTTKSSSEKPKSNKKEETTAQKNHSASIKEAVEYKTGKKLPEDKEELFRNFDELIPKEIDHIDIADKVKEEDEHASLYRYSREGMKSSLEIELYGSTMKEVNDYFRSELESIEKELEKTQRSKDLGYKEDFNPKLLARHDKYVDLFNQISAGAIGNPLAEIELQINSNFANESEKENLRKFAERLSAEMYKDRPKNKIDVGDIKEQIKKEAKIFSDVEDENVKSDNEKHFKGVLESLDKGDLISASEEIEFNIGWIQERLEERKNPDLKNVSEEMLKKRYGENFMPAINKELEKLREYRKFLTVEKSEKEKIDNRENVIDADKFENKNTETEKERKQREETEESELKKVRNKIDWIISPNENLKESLSGDIDKKILGLEKEIQNFEISDYLSSKERSSIIEKLGEKDIEKITSGISNKIKESGLFGGKRELGIDVWNPRLEDSKLPFSFVHGEKRKSAKSDHASGGARFEAGKIIVDPKMPSLKNRLENWVDGYDGDFLLTHETLHGFQTADPKLCQEFAELDIEYESIDPDKLTDDDRERYWNKKSELKQKWAEKLGIKPNEVEKVINGENPNDTKEDYNARWALREVHSYWARINYKDIKDREKSIEENVVNGYGLPEKATKEGIELIRQMKALKIDDKTIGKLIFLTKIDLSSKEVFTDLSKFIKDFKNNNGISDEKMQKLSRLADLEEAKELLMLKQMANKELSDYYKQNRGLKNTFKNIFKKKI